MKVYQMEMILGKEAQYSQQGKLKNSKIVPKYSGERELEDILDDKNWLKIGACEIKCIGVYDTELKKHSEEAKAEVNKRIEKIVKGLDKPKTEIELLKEQNELLKAQLLKGTVIDYRATIEAKATELEIKFRADISDEKLIERIKEIEPDFTL